MRFRRTFGLSLMALVAATLASAQQPPNIGIAPVPLGPGPYVFDTAEQHAIRVDVVVRGLAHPFSFGFLPNGDALVVERGANIRLVKHATGDAELDPTVLRHAPFSDVQLRHDLEARGDGRAQAGRQDLRFPQVAVDAVSNRDAVGSGLDMDVR